MRAFWFRAALGSIVFAWAGSAAALDPDVGDIYVADPSDSYVVETPASPDLASQSPAPQNMASSESLVAAQPEETYCRDYRPARGGATTGTVCAQADGSLRMVDAPPPAEASDSFTPAPQPARARASQYCREYQQTVIAGGVAQAAYGTACLQADGSWQIVTPAVASGLASRSYPTAAARPGFAAPSVMTAPSYRTFVPEAYYPDAPRANVSTPVQMQSAPVRITPALSARIYPAQSTAPQRPQTRVRTAPVRNRLFAWLTRRAENKRKAHDKRAS